MSDAPDPIERAHLLDESGFTPPVHRRPPSPDLAQTVRRYWIPVWSLPEGVTSVQRVLQYPVSLLVIAADYQRLIGPSTGLSVKELSGTGWALGVMLQPAPGESLWGGRVHSDAEVDWAEVPALDPDLPSRVRSLMSPDPGSSERQHAALALVEDELRRLPPIDPDGLRVNAIVEFIESSRITRVEEICAEFALTERSLQRLFARRVGLGPKWLIQRRRLHEVAERLTAAGTAPRMAELAAELGYSDQAHLTRDFRAVTGKTPGAFAAEPRPGAAAERSVRPG